MQIYYPCASCLHRSFTHFHKVKSVCWIWRDVFVRDFHAKKVREILNKNAKMLMHEAQCVNLSMCAGLSCCSVLFSFHFLTLLKDWNSNGVSRPKTVIRELQPPFAMCCRQSHWDFHSIHFLILWTQDCLWDAYRRIDAVRRIASLPVALCVYCDSSCSSWTTNNHLISPYNLHILHS